MLKGEKDDREEGVELSAGETLDALIIILERWDAEKEKEEEEEEANLSSMTEPSVYSEIQSTNL